MNNIPKVCISALSHLLTALHLASTKYFKADPLEFENVKNNILTSIQTIFDYIDENGEGHSLAKAHGNEDNNMKNNSIK